MPHEILDSMRALREDMRQRLLQVPEYRALVSLDRTIDELCAIMQEGVAQPALDYARQAQAQAPVQAPAPEPVNPQMMAPQMAAQAPMATQPAPRLNGIATAFAETLAAKIDQRNLARAANLYAPPVHRALGA